MHTIVVVIGLSDWIVIFWLLQDPAMMEQLWMEHQHQHQPPPMHPMHAQQADAWQHEFQMRMHSQPQMVCHLSLHCLDGNSDHMSGVIQMPWNEEFQRSFDEAAHAPLQAQIDAVQHREVNFLCVLLCEAADAKPFLLGIQLEGAWTGLNDSNRLDLAAQWEEAKAAEADSISTMFSEAW